MRADEPLQRSRIASACVAMNKYNVRFHEERIAWSDTGRVADWVYCRAETGKGQAANKGIDPGDILLEINGRELGKPFDQVLQTLKRAGRPVDMVFATLVNAETRMEYFGQEEPLYFGGLGQHGENASVLNGRGSLLGGNKRSGGGGNERRTSITASGSVAARGSHAANKGRPGPPPRRPPRPDDNKSCTATTVTWRRPSTSR